MSLCRLEKYYTHTQGADGEGETLVYKKSLYKSHMKVIERAVGI